MTDRTTEDDGQGASVLVSGAADHVASVAAALRARGAQVTEVPELEDLPDVCARAGAGAFDAYVQLAATLALEGDSAVERVRQFYADGVLARFSALDAARPALAEDAELVFVMGVLSGDVAHEEDRQARHALTTVLARAARADHGPGRLRVRILPSDTGDEAVAALALGRAPGGEPAVPDRGDSLVEWRMQLMSVMFAET